MLENWLNPTAISTAAFPKHSWGANIKLFTGKSFTIKQNAIAFIGVHATLADACRQALFPMSWVWGKQQVYDLGNLHKPHSDFMIPLLQELLENKVFPILIGQDAALFGALFQAILTSRDQTNLVLLDELLPFSPTDKKDKSLYLNEAIHKRRERIFHINLIGTQRHFAAPDAWDWWFNENFSIFRLGEVLENLPAVEPLLRDADLMGMHLSVLKYGEAPIQQRQSLSGLYLEQACQLCHYAGMSDKLAGFGLFGMDPQPKQALPLAAQALAQLVWYLTDGFCQRKGDFPTTNKGMTEYIVDWKDHNEKLIFWKSPRSGRWWLQVPGKVPKKWQRHQLIPCNYEDYELSSQGDLPDRLWEAIRRFV